MVAQLLHQKLIAKLQPKYAIIMAGRVEKFAFPHIETIQTLNEYNIKFIEQI